MQTDETDLILRKATKGDLEKLVKMARKAFLDTFSQGNKIENVNAYLDEAFTFRQFSEELSVSASSFFIMLDADRIVGYSKVNLVPAQTDIHDSDSLEIARLYISKEYLGRGLGKALLGHALDFAKQNEKKYVWLGVWEHNRRAIRFYKKNGFAKFGSHPFPFGDEVQTDWLMRHDF